MHKFGEGSTVLAEKLNFLPDISDPGQYQGAFALGTVTKLGKWLGWQNQFSDIYVSNPPIGTKKNDLILTTGLNFRLRAEGLVWEPSGRASVLEECDYTK